MRETLQNFQNQMKVPSVGEAVQIFLPFMILFIIYKCFFQLHKQSAF